MHKNYPRFVGRWAGETALVHGGGSRLGDSIAVRSVGDLTATDRHLVQKFLRHGRPSTLEAIVGSTLSMSTSASAPACGAYDRPHGRQEDAGQGDKDVLLEGTEGRRGDIL